MKQTKIYIYGIGLLLMTQALQAAENWAEALSSGHTELSFRYRYETINSDAFERDAHASTLKTRLNYSTLPHKGLTFFLEVDDVTEVFGDHFNSGAGTSPNRSRYPVVADPEGTEVNQAWLNWRFQEHDFKLGRQRILLDNQRFVGGVAWRQNEQTFDAAQLNLDVADSQFKLIYIDQVNRIFGEDVPAGQHEHETLLFNWSKNWQGQHQLVLFYYDINNKDVSSFSTRTHGVSFETFKQLNDSLLSFGLDYANQSAAGDNPVQFDAHYWRLEVALETQMVDWIIGREVLTGDASRSGAAFRTPLATLHAFNGWSDQFLATPDAGLQDTYVGMIGSYLDLGWYLRLHQFEAEASNLTYGYEVDASLTYSISNKASAQLKWARYNAQDLGADTQHLWLVFNYNF